MTRLCLRLPVGNAGRQCRSTTVAMPIGNSNDAEGIAEEILLHQQTGDREMNRCACPLAPRLNPLVGW